MSAPSTAPVVETRGLVKRYDDELAVAGIDLLVNRGEIYGLVGPNGAGKTTTMRILATLLSPTAGEAFVTGIPVTADPSAVRRQIGYMPDFYGVYDDLRVWEYLDFFARCYGVPANRGGPMIGELLEIVDLSAKRDAYVESLSRGMRQRLCLAHTLVHDPALLILDEPASGLDPRARVEMREILRELRGMGKTILVSSHILPGARRDVHRRGDHRPRPRPALRHDRRDRAIPASLGAPAHRSRRRRGGSRGRGDVARERPGVADVLPVGDASEGVARLEVSFDGPAGAQADLLRRMLEAGHRVAASARRPPTSRRSS